jgi:lipopolysaccharide transport protein LptA
MAPSVSKLPVLAACGWLVASAAAEPPAGSTAPLTPLGDEPIVVDAASSEADLAHGTGVFSSITITQGGVRLRADHAHGSYPVDFKNSHWTFEGHVRIDDSDRHGSLRADQAVVDFKDGRIERATVTGKPAEFEQRRPDKRVARGRADEINYDITDGTVRLTNDAWLSDGQDEISGPLLVYNIRAQRIQAAAPPAGDQRVHIVITPQGTSTRTAPAKPAPSPEPAPPPPPPPPQS